MAPRLKIWMSSGSEKRNPDILFFSLRNSWQVNPFQVPQRGPYGERYTLTGHFYISKRDVKISFYLSLRVAGKGAPSMFPNRVPMDRDTPSPEPLVYLFIPSFMHVCWSPRKGAILHMEKNIRSPSTEPHADGRPTYDGVRPGSPRGLFWCYCVYFVQVWLFKDVVNSSDVQ